MYSFTRPRGCGANFLRILYLSRFTAKVNCSSMPPVRLECLKPGGEAHRKCGGGLVLPHRTSWIVAAGERIAAEASLESPAADIA